MICSFNFLIFLAVCLNISTVINIKILANSNQQTQRYKFNSRIAAFLSVILITEMLEICIQIAYNQNVQLILKSYLPIVYGTTLRQVWLYMCNLKNIIQTKHENTRTYLCQDQIFCTRWHWINRFISFSALHRKVIFTGI